MDTALSFWTQLINTTPLEAIAVVAGIASVLFNIKEKIWVYPVGLISVTIYIYITFEYKLYADAAINGYYFIMSLYGWWNWKQVKEGATALPITKTTGKAHLINLLTLSGAFLTIWYVLSHYTDSDVPVWDATTTAFAITGMYLMALKKIEHWLCWIICDAVSVPLYIYKGLPFSSFQFLAFTYLAVRGYIAWNKKLTAYES